MKHQVFHDPGRRAYIVQPRPVGMPERVSSDSLAWSRTNETQLFAGSPQVAPVNRVRPVGHLAGNEWACEDPVFIGREFGLLSPPLQDFRKAII